MHEHVVYIAMLLLLGTLSTALAHIMRVSNIFFLLLTGMVLGSLGLVIFPDRAVETIALLALILVVFDATSKLRASEFRQYGGAALKLALTYFVFNLLFVTAFAMLLFGQQPLVAMFFATLMYGIDPGACLAIFGHKRTKAVETLEIESVLNTPLTLIIPLTMLRLITYAGASVAGAVLMQLGVALGVGALSGCAAVYILKKIESKELLHLIVMSSAVITFALSESLGGSGLLAVTLFGLVFGNSRLHHKIELKKFATIFTHTLTILVFILIGTTMQIDPSYIFRGTILFLVYLCARFAAVYISGFGGRDALLVSFSVPKGIDVAVVLLILMSSSIAGMGEVVNLSMLFALYSIVLTTAVSALYRPRAAPS
ncbi:MAG: cation:proton antiporter [archaeon]